ncbi:hypothetical protein [uncultured Shewanella sp.]|uniref:hypothetical protein n=1 Tax=uncultured Shewanella sp. TaxID=173975 RepID=UPI002619067F|nr:hypothetical protein [uncultured Shewanella sp.]
MYSQIGKLKKQRNKWVTHPVTLKKGIVQRMIVLNNYHNVYIPAHLDPGNATERDRMKTAINTLTNRNDNVVFVSTSGFDDVMQENISKETQKLLRMDNKYIEKKEAHRLTAVAGRAQQDRTLDPDQRKAVIDQLGRDLNVLTVNPTWEKNVELRQQFSDEKQVYIYPNDTELDNPYTFPTERKLIAPVDMLDAPGVLGAVGNPNEICAIQAISDLQGDVHTMWGDLDSDTSVPVWHAACRTKGLDYRNDNEYIKILMKLGFTLVQNDPVIYNAIDWTAANLGDGDYFLATGAGDIGHAIGVRVVGGVDTVLDRQELHNDAVVVKYIFKK